MNEENTFLQHIPDVRNVVPFWDASNRFGTEANKETIGILLVMFHC